MALRNPEGADRLVLRMETVLLKPTLHPNDYCNPLAGRDQPIFSDIRLHLSSLGRGFVVICLLLPLQWSNDHLHDQCCLPLITCVSFVEYEILFETGGDFLWCFFRGLIFDRRYFF